MEGYLHRCTLLLVWLAVLLSRLSLGTTNIARPACRLDSIQLFNISQVDCVNTTWSLYKKNILIIVWEMLDSNPRATYANGHKDKFFLDKSRNIWILDIQDSDEAIYSIRCPVGNATKKHEVKLDVLVEPETRCKPKIIRGVDTLTTYLEPDGCGKPVASAYWLDQPGIFIDDNVIKLQPGQEAGTVYACINSPSLRCAKNSKLFDYCSVYKEESRIHPRLSEISGVTIANLVITTLLGGLFIMMAIFFYRRLMGMLKNNAQWRYLPECKFCKTERIASYIAGTQPLETDSKLERVDETHKQSMDEALPLLEDIETANCSPPHEPEETIPMLELMENGNLSKSQASDEHVLRSQRKFTENATPSLEQEEPIPNFDDKKTTPQQLSDNEHEIKEATTENPSSTNAEVMKELQELRDAALCKICFGEKTSMVFMPCNHIATCAKCSIALQQCPVCRALIKKKMNIRF